MFQKLNRKYTKVLLFTVMIVLTLYSLVIYFLYSRLLTEDYCNKFNYFGQQQAASIERKLKIAEYSLYHIYDIKSSMESSSNTGIYQTLSRIKSCNLDIEHIFLTASERSYCTTPSDYSLCSMLQQQYPQLFDSAEETMQWYYLKYQDSSRDALLCLRSQIDETPENSYTVGITVPVSTILPSFHFSSDNQFFSVSSFSLSLSSDQDYTLLMDASSDGTKQQDPNTFSDSGVFSCEIAQSPFTLYMQDTNRSGLYRLLSIFLVGLLALCLVLFLTAFTVLRRFLNRLTDCFMKISQEISDFFDSLDATKKM